MADLSASEKLMGDYAFAADLDEGEILFSHAGKILTRYDMKTLLLGGSVNIDVINVWCDYLNYGNRFRDRRSLSRLFLTETTDISALDINFRDVKLVFFPVVEPKPLLHCFDVDQNFFEVIHPCDRGSPDYYDRAQYVKKQLSARLSTFIPKLQSTYLLVANEYVPNEHFHVERDTGIYMMRHMETYNGNKSRYGFKLLKDRTAVKRYIVRVCNEILTWKNNIVKVQLTSKAKAYKNGCETRNVVPRGVPYPRDVPYSNEQLMNFIRTNVANKQDVVVDTKWLQVTQEAMSTLFRGNWLMDMVIDIVGIRKTLERPDLVYFPTIIKDVVAKDSFRSQYIKLEYLPRSLPKAKLAFFPYCVDRDHWFACVSDFDKKTNFILDSSMSRRVDGRRQFLVQTLFPALEIIASELWGYKRLLRIKKFEWEIVDVPRQNNGYSCGIYLLKWLENLSCQSLWSKKTSYENLDEYGESLIVDLIRWEENKRKDYN